MKYRLAPIAALGPLLFVTVIIILCGWRMNGPGVSHASFQKLTTGMTRKQVQDILGGPAHEEIRYRHIFLDKSRPGYFIRWAEWRGEECTIHVGWHDTADCALEIRCEGCERSFADRVRSWLPW